MNRINVLLVEDEQTLAMIIKDTLSAQGFDITVACDGHEGLKLFSEIHPDVVVADVMMPRMDGFEINDVVHGFELGCNDYLKKPFGMQELMVRIRALLRRTAVSDGIQRRKSEWMEIGKYMFNPILQCLQYGDMIEELSHREAEILRRLAEKRNEVVLTRDILLDLWGDDSFFNTRSLQVFITKLRHKLAKDDSLRIVNVRGFGYKLIQA